VIACLSALSRLKHEFDSRRGHHIDNASAIAPAESPAKWAGSPFKRRYESQITSDIVFGLDLAAITAN
jgi:hypothetical protein